MTSALPPGKAFVLVWLPWLAGLQSIPHTGALRTALLVIGIGHVLWLWRQAPPAEHVLAGKREGWLFLALTAWLLLQAALFAPAPPTALASLVGEWGRVILMGALGVTLVRFYGGAQGRWLAVALFAGSFLHVLSTLALQVGPLARGGELVFGDSLLGNYGYVSPFTTTACAWLLADGVSRLWRRQGLFPWPAAVSAVLALATLAAEALLRAKAGQVMTVALVVACVAAFVARSGPRRRHGALLLAAMLVAALTLVAIGGERWQGAVESMTTAWNDPAATKALTRWEDGPSPAHGLDASFYLRAAWAKMGLEGIARHPWGLGYGADAFGRYVTERYGVTGAISSHSGWIDFALANGLLGLVLLLAVAVALMRRGWRAFLSGEPAGAALALLVFHYIGRCLIDGILTGSRLTGFALVVGIVWGLAARNRDATGPG